MNVLDLVLSLAVVALAAAFIAKRFWPAKEKSAPVEVGDSLQRALDKAKQRRA